MKLRRQYTAAVLLLALELVLVLAALAWSVRTLLRVTIKA